MARPGCLVALAGLLCLQQAAGYSFVSCTNYNATSGVCLGYPRKYIQWVGGASHAYNLQADLPANTNQNLTGVDPLLQNRTVTASAAADAAMSPQYQVVNEAYDQGYPMASAVPGQNLTITWPRTAEPDGDPVTSPFAWIYYWPNSTANAGQAFNVSQDPLLPTFQQNQLAQLTYNAANGTTGNCPVIDDSGKYDISQHCNGMFTVPANLTRGIYTFLWYWRIEQPQLYRLYPIAFEVNVQQPVMAVVATTPVATAG